ncbi:hypothetical protein U1Q18_026741 [Sarracenia purpurea var. burkii]
MASKKWSQGYRSYNDDTDSVASEGSDAKEPTSARSSTLIGGFEGLPMLVDDEGSRGGLHCEGREKNNSEGRRQLGFALMGSSVARICSKWVISH